MIRLLWRVTDRAGREARSLSFIELVMLLAFALSLCTAFGMAALVTR